MLPENLTAIVARNETWTGLAATEPYEAGWASEGVFFIQTEGVHPALRLQPEISPDGVNWVPIESPSDMASETTIAALRLQNFAGWLRLTIAGATAAEPATVLIHLALKG